MPRQGLGTALAMLGLLLVASPAPAAATEPSFGLYVQDEDVERPQTALLPLAQLGATHVRADWRWSQFEPERGRHDWALGDRYAEAAARAGLDLVPTLMGTPAWASGSDRYTFQPPRDPEDLADFAAAAVRRYGPAGHFWRTHPELPARPVRRWQIWNEPNLPAFWRPRPVARDYATLLEAASKAIRREDLGAEVVMAGLPLSAHGVSPLKFLDRVYRAGARGSFDSVAVHPYAVNPTAALATVQAIKRIVDRSGDPVPLRITEFGWATGGEESLLRADPELHAALVRETILALRAGAERMRLSGLTYFKWRDRPAPPGRRDTWPFHTGLMDRDRSAKPALHAAASALRAPAPTLAPAARGRLRLRMRVPRQSARAMRRNGVLLRVGCSRPCRLEVAVSHERRHGNLLDRRIAGRAVWFFDDASGHSVHVRVPRADVRSARREGARLVVRPAALDATGSADALAHVRVPLRRAAPAPVSSP